MSDQYSIPAARYGSVNSIVSLPNSKRKLFAILRNPSILQKQGAQEFETVAGSGPHAQWTLAYISGVG